MYQDNSSDWTDDGDWYGEDDGQLATVGGFSSGQSVSTNSVGSQQSYYQSGQSTGSSGSSQTHRAHSAMTASTATDTTTIDRVIHTCAASSAVTDDIE